MKTAAFLSALLAALTPALFAQDAPIHRERIEWCDAWMPNMNDHDMPRVLLIGDSITRGYYPIVEQLLKGKAYVARITTSKAVGDPALLDELATFLKQARFDAVHFNIGMHGWAYSEDEYRRHFPALAAAIRKHAPQAKLVWASTTPIRVDSESGASNTRIARRNAIALEFAAAETIPVDDLHALMTPHADLHSDNVHFNKEGSTLMAEQVARELLKLLPAR
jgi:lysophospholipase L1-like esterase